METQARHKPGVFKQPNKAHKTGRHRSKGEILKSNNGKVGQQVLSRKKKDVRFKNERKNRLFQIRKNKREEIVNKKRSIGALSGSPHIVSIIPLNIDVNCLDIIESLKNCDSQATTKISDTGIYTIESARFKSKYNFLIPNPLNPNAIIDAIKITDTCLFVISTENNGIDEFGSNLFDMIYSFHLPASIFITQGLKQMPIKTQSLVRNDLQKAIENKLPDSKLISLDSDSDGLNLLHKISQHKLNSLKFNELRPYLLVDNYEFQADKLNHEVGTLKVCGYLRGRNLDVNSLVYFPSLGTFQMSEINALKRSSDKTMESWELIQKADESAQESLETEAIFDQMNAEQTWPTEQELKEAHVKTVKKRVPKGTSEYQAAWILDSDEEEEDDDGDEDEEDDGMADDENEEEDDEAENIDDDESVYDQDNDEEMEVLTCDENRYDDKLDLEEEKQTLEKIKLAKSNEEFPDEVDTPMDVAARIRFQKYRGLKSFRTSPWDKFENLPIEYARIFQFEDIKRTFKKISKEKLEGAEQGSYIQVSIKNIPSSFSFMPGHPLIMYSLLKHENKMSIMNIKLKRTNLEAYSLPIKSKEPLIYHIGARRFEASSIFSQHTTGNKHKFERFMPTDVTFVSTLIAPITFSSASVLVFKKLDDGKEILVAIGSLLSIEPHRIILKRIVLSGHPFRVSKKNAVVRYMFFSPEDVNWFKPVELRTRYGRRGHIKETLGTHGHMKCQFNDVMKTQDCVLMNLYKRVYPKWVYNDLSKDFYQN